MDSPGEQRLIGEIIVLLRQVIGEDRGWAERVTPSARLDQDLRLDSLEVTALAGLLQGTYGSEVDLAAFLAGLDFDQLVALTVRDLAGYVRARGGAGGGR